MEKQMMGKGRGLGAGQRGALVLVLQLRYPALCPSLRLFQCTLAEDIATTPARGRSDTFDGNAEACCKKYICTLSNSGISVSKGEKSMHGAAADISYRRPISCPE